MTSAWMLGEVCVMRHAGFPFDWLEGLGLAPEVQAALGRMLECEDRLRAEASASLPQKELQTLEAALRQVAPERLGANVRKRLGKHLSDYEAARAEAEAVHARDRQRLRRKLHEVASEPGIQEAVFISSPAVFENVWRRYLEGGLEKDNADTRRMERQVYTYLQRFCAKNETTSFFGPIAYGEKTRALEAPLRVRPTGDTSRRTFFSFWAVSELARAIGRDRQLRAHVPLRINPLFVRESGRAHCAPLQLSVELSPELETLLERLDTSSTIASLAAQAGRTTPEMERLLLPLLRQAFLLMGLRFDANAFETHEALLTAVRELPEGEPRSRWIQALEELGAMKARYQGADLAGRRELLPRLEARFTELTGKPARRGEGQVYSDRLIVYEEASSPFRLELSEGLLGELARALAPALDMSAAYGERVQQRYREQVRSQWGDAPDTLSFLDYAVRMRPAEVEGTRFSPVPPVTLRFEPGERSVAVDPAVHGQPVHTGRYALPDVFLAERRTEEGVRYDALLGRVHHHLLLWGWLSAFHADRDRYEGSAVRWLTREPQARGLASLGVRRRNKGFYVFPGRRLVYAISDVLDVEEGALTASDVTVHRGEEALELRDDEGRPLSLYMPLDDFSHYAPLAALAHPLVLHVPFRTEAGHVPRLHVGGVLYQRERWELDGAPLEGLQGFALLVAVHRERRRNDWPRFLFVRSTKERKPYLIDSESPFAMELLRHAIQGADWIRFEEMYPAPGELWLRDERGRYTCELRMQATRWSTVVDG